MSILKLQNVFLFTAGHNWTLAVPGKILLNYGITCFSNLIIPYLTNFTSPSLTLPGAHMPYLILTPSPNLGTFKELGTRWFKKKFPKFCKNDFGTTKVQLCLPWYPEFVPQITGGVPPGLPVIVKVSVWQFVALLKIAPGAVVTLPPVS